MYEKYEVIHYVENGHDIFENYVKSLRNRRGQFAIYNTVDRLEDGNFGNNHYCRDGVWELIIDTGPGYRVYYAKVGNKIILLLCAGSKRTQNKDINSAIEFLKKYRKGF